MRDSIYPTIPISNMTILLEKPFPDLPFRQQPVEYKRLHCRTPQSSIVTPELCAKIEEDRNLRPATNGKYSFRSKQTSHTTKKSSAPYSIAQIKYNSNYIKQIEPDNERPKEGANFHNEKQERRSNKISQSHSATSTPLAQLQSWSLYNMPTSYL